MREAMLLFAVTLLLFVVLAWERIKYEVASMSDFQKIAISIASISFFAMVLLHATGIINIQTLIFGH